MISLLFGTSRMAFSNTTVDMSNTILKSVFYYKNMLGIELCQKIQIEIIFEYEKQSMLLAVNEMSPQTGLV